MIMDENLLLYTAVKAAQKAAEEIMDVYMHDFGVEYKKDQSPLTIADRRAHTVICQVLEESGLPVLSEEGRNIPYEERKNWKTFWLVDPLDGTKEFIKRNDEFTVNIALISEGRPVAGVILVPVTRVLYFAGRHIGARKMDAGEMIFNCLDDLVIASRPLPFDRVNEVFTVVASRSHMSEETLAYIEELKSQHAALEFVSTGSSLKLCLVAEGTADIYPRFGPTMEWDTAAGQAILEISGGKVFLPGSHEIMNYNKADLLNPWFVASR